MNDVTIDGIILPDERKLTMVNLTQVGSSGEMRITSGSLGFIKFIDEIDQIQGIKGSYSVIASIISWNEKKLTLIEVAHTMSTFVRYIPYFRYIYSLDNDEIKIKALTG